MQIVQRQQRQINIHILRIISKVNEKETPPNEIYVYFV